MRAHEMEERAAQAERTLKDTRKALMQEGLAIRRQMEELRVRARRVACGCVRVWVCECALCAHGFVRVHACGEQVHARQRPGIRASASSSAGLFSQPTHAARHFPGHCLCERVCLCVCLCTRVCACVCALVCVHLPRPQAFSPVYQSKQVNCSQGLAAAQEAQQQQTGHMQAGRRSMHMHTHTHAQTCTRTCMYAHARMHAHAHTCTRLHTRTHNAHKTRALVCAGTNRGAGGHRQCGRGEGSRRAVSRTGTVWRLGERERVAAGAAAAAAGAAGVWPCLRVRVCPPPVPAYCAGACVAVHFQPCASILQVPSGSCLCAPMQQVHTLHCSQAG